MLVFRKQVDNLKTNHRGVYVLTDNAFRPLARMSADAGGQAVLRAQPVCHLISPLPPSPFPSLFSSFLHLLPPPFKKEKEKEKEKVLFR